jgi:acyl carrier protein
MTHDDTPTTTSRPLSPDQARAAVVDAILRIVPDADLEAIGPDTPLRGELELDSLDFLSFVEQLSSRTGVRIDESDYPRLTTMTTCAEFLSPTD